jgi:hypothetical protein
MISTFMLFDNPGIPEFGEVRAWGEVNQYGEEGFAAQYMSIVRLFGSDLKLAQSLADALAA